MHITCTDGNLLAHLSYMFGSQLCIPDPTMETTDREQIPVNMFSNVLAFCSSHPCSQITSYFNLFTIRESAQGPEGRISHSGVSDTVGALEENIFIRLTLQLFSNHATQTSKVHQGVKLTLFITVIILKVYS